MDDVNTSAGRGGARSDVVESVPPIASEREYVFEALAHARRRHVCSLLADRGEWPLEELASRIAAREAATTPGADVDVDEQRLNAVRVSLLHQHLPVLAQRDVVEYDEDGAVVTAGPRAPVVQSVLAGVSAVLGTPPVRRAERAVDG